MQANPNTQFEIDLSKYQIIGNIGSGSFGNVYKIQEKETKKYYAAKVLLGSNEQFVDREIRILMCSNHPTIVKFIGYSLKDFENNRNVTLILELAQNGSLTNLIEKIQKDETPTNFTNTSRQIILIGIARGMKYLHDRNIIHRDLKTANILLDENFFPLITDFGVSKYFDVGKTLEQTYHGGTLAYAAPEALGGEDYNQSVDVYSFAVVMFEVLTNSFAYPENRNQKVNFFRFTKKVIDENYRPQFTVDVKEPLKKLIEKCWSKNPEERPTFKDIFEKVTNPYYFLDDVDYEKCNEYIKLVTAVKDPLEKLLLRVEPAEDMNSQLTIDNKILINENIQLTIQYEAMRIENERLKKDAQNSIQLKTSNDQLSSENKQLKTDNKKISSKNKILKSENKQLSSSQINLAADLDRLTNSNHELSMRVKQLTNENKQLSNENKKVKIENVDLASSNDKLFNESRQLSSEFKRLTTENKQLTALNKRLSSQNAKLTNENSQLTATNEIMKSQLIALKKELSKLTKKSPNSSFDTDDDISDSSNSFPFQFDSNMTIEVFNTLPLKNQKNAASRIKSLFMKKVSNNVINFLLRFKELETYCCFEIASVNNEKPLSMVGKDDEIHLFSNVTEILHSKSLLNSKSFINNIKVFDNFRIEIKYPSDSFKSIYNQILEVRKNYFEKSNFQIGIHFSGVEKTDKNFNYDNNINFVRIDSSVREIEDSFEGCTSLSNLLIEHSVTSIKGRAFKGCNSLTKVIIPSSIEMIGKDSFASCSSLVSVLFDADSSLSLIGESSFHECSSLTTITIPSSVKSIEKSAFDSCLSLSQVVFEQPSSVTSIGENAFCDCSSLTSIETFPSLTKIQKGTFSRCSLLGQLSIQFPLTNIEGLAFIDCISLTKITFPSSLKFIGQNAFENCASLSEVVFESPSSVSLISSSAFGECSSLKQIIIPPSVAEIESNAFIGCSSLESVEFDGKSSLKSIGENAFCGCSSLKKVSLPPSVNEIRPFAFKGCLNLVQVCLPSSVDSIQNGLFKNCSALKDLLIPQSVKSIRSSAFENCASLERVLFESPSSVASIGDYAFCKCSLLTEISIPSSVTSVSQFSFKSCKSLHKITVHSSLDLEDVMLDSDIVVEKI